MRKLVILIFLPSLIVLNCLQYTKALVYLNIFNRTVILVSSQRVEEVTFEIGGKSESHLVTLLNTAQTTQEISEKQ